MVLHDRGRQVKVPLVIRSIIGRGWGSAAQHSQALHGLFLHVPGLKIVVPSTPYDAKGLLIAAVEDGTRSCSWNIDGFIMIPGYVPPRRCIPCPSARGLSAEKEAMRPSWPFPRWSMKPSKRPRFYRRGD